MKKILFLFLCIYSFQIFAQIKPVLPLPSQKQLKWQELEYYGFVHFNMNTFTNVEWGEGVFGAEAAAQHYFRKPAAQLSAWEAARLAVMLPRPRYFEKRPDSPYLASRAEVIVGRMNDVALP